MRPSCPTVFVELSYDDCTTVCANCCVGISWFSIGNCLFINDVSILGQVYMTVLVAVISDSSLLRVGLSPTGRLSKWSGNGIFAPFSDE
jgi:hypothetical protein